MAQYVQLLGSDTPNGYGGCCFYGPMDHPALSPTPPCDDTTTAPATTSLSGMAKDGDGGRFAWPTGGPLHRSTAHADDTSSGGDGYIFFNCPEGTQRFSSEANIKLTRVRLFCLTRWGATAASRPGDRNSGGGGAASAVMGLPGALFTVNDAGVRHATFFGPSSIGGGDVSYDMVQINAAQESHERCSGDCQSPAVARLHRVAEVREPNESAASSAMTSSTCGGLGQFLLALRRHYFSYRPMTFRLLVPVYPVAPVVMAQGSSGVRRVVGAASLAGATPACRNELHFIETPSLDQLPLIVGVLPIGGQSFLIAFRVSPAVARMPKDESKASANEKNCEAELSYISVDSSGWVVGYAIVVAPAPSFNAAKARALGVRPGPKFKQLKNGQAVEADQPAAAAVRAAGGTARGRKRSKCNTGSGEAEPLTAIDVPLGSDDVEGTSSATSGPCMVYPHEVMQNTVASQHLYVSLVLDGDHPEEVRSAVAKLLGCATGDSCTDGLASEGPRASAEHQPATQRGGALHKVLALLYPQFAFYTRDADADNDADAGGDSGRCSEGPTQRRVRRQVVVRHVIHVQPSCYFESFRANMAGRNLHQAASAKGSPSAPRNAADLYAQYNAYVFQDVDTAATQFSTAPLASFTEDDIIEADPHTAAAPAPLAPSLQVTRHLFTCHIQQCFTAFPTALVHRYHLQRLAPGLFPLRGVDDCPVSTPTSLAGVAQSSISGAAAVELLWPYSFKLRCVPDGSLHPQPLKLQPPPRRLPSPASAAAALVAVRDSTVSGAVDLPPTKREKADPCDTTTATAKASTAAESADRLSPRHSLHRRRLAVVDGGSSVLCYPSRQSACALLSNEFLTAAVPLQSPCPASVETVRSNQMDKANAVARTSTSPASPLALNESSIDSSEQQHESFLAQYIEAADDGGGALGCLGTGSAVPSKYRNVSGTYLELHLPAYCFDAAGEAASAGSHGPAADIRWTAMRRGIIILDFGEGSAGQLASLLQSVKRGPLNQECHSSLWPTSSASPAPMTDRAIDDGVILRRFVMDVLFVFISHAHADHHLGLLTLLTLRHSFRLSSLCAGASSAESPPFSSVSDETNASSKLLVICPQEVYDFLMDAWGSTAPYCDWLLAEVDFDIMKPHPACSGSSDTSVSWQNDADPAVMEFPSDSTFPQDVVAAPKLDALLQSWTASIRRWTAAMARRAAAVPSPSSPLSPEGSGRVATDGLPPGGAWWDAEVFTVDHPANAHALLLRFPYGKAVTLLQDGRDAVESAATAEVNRHALGQRQSPSSCVIPLVVDDSRVFLFSGDTRPSSFLVSRSRQFSSRRRGSAEERYTTASPSSLFLCLHEATFGPGFEAEARQKRHSTLPEALLVGAAVQAEFIVLHHFSQRYPKLPGLTARQLGSGRSPNLLQQRRRPSSTTPAPPVLPSSSDPYHDTSATITAEDGGVVRFDSRNGTANHGCHRGEGGGSAVTDEPAVHESMSFAFDLMRISFAALHDGAVSSLTPTLVRLLEEYDSWGVGTTQRMRRNREI